MRFDSLGKTVLVCAVALAMTGLTMPAPPLTDAAPDFAPLALPLRPLIFTPDMAWPGARPIDGMPALPAVLLMLMPVPESVPPATKLDS